VVPIILYTQPIQLEVLHRKIKRSNRRSVAQSMTTGSDNVCVGYNCGNQIIEGS
jgi:hypothetical protein